jgi:hypothetical protein
MMTNRRKTLKSEPVVLRVRTRQEIIDRIDEGIRQLRSGQ